jgi:hypothetical protein
LFEQWQKDLHSLSPRGFDAVADRRGFIVTYPEGSDRARPLLNALGKPGFLTWNAGGCCGYAVEHGIDDVGFIRAMVAETSHAGIEARHAQGHADAMAKHRAHLADSIAQLERTQDQLLDELSAAT